MFLVMAHYSHRTAKFESFLIFLAFFSVKDVSFEGGMELSDSPKASSSKLNRAVF